MRGKPAKQTDQRASVLFWICLRTFQAGKILHGVEKSARLFQTDPYGEHRNQNPVSDLLDSANRRVGHHQHGNLFGHSTHPHGIHARHSSHGTA